MTVCSEFLLVTSLIKADCCIHSEWDVDSTDGTTCSCSNPSMAGVGALGVATAWSKPIVQYTVSCVVDPVDVQLFSSTVVE